MKIAAQNRLFCDWVTRGRQNRSPCGLVNMTITVDLVEAFLKCPTKCFLRSGGEAGTGNAYAAWLQTKNNAFRIEGTKRLVAGVAPDKCAIGPQAMENPKPAQRHLGMDFAVQSQNLQCFGRPRSNRAVCPDSICVQKQTQSGRQASTGV